MLMLQLICNCMCLRKKNIFSSRSFKLPYIRIGLRNSALTRHRPDMFLKSSRVWFHPLLYLCALVPPYLSFRCRSHSLTRSPPPTICPALLLLLLLLFILYVSLSSSLSHVEYLSASYFLYLSVPFALTPSPLPLSILIFSTPEISSQHLGTHLSSSLPIFISSLSGSPSLPLSPSLAYLSVSALARSQWARLS